MKTRRNLQISRARALSLFNVITRDTHCYHCTIMRYVSKRDFHSVCVCSHSIFETIDRFFMKFGRTLYDSRSLQPYTHKHPGTIGDDNTADTRNCRWKRHFRCLLYGHKLKHRNVQPEFRCTCTYAVSISLQEITCYY